MKIWLLCLSLLFFPPRLFSYWFFIQGQYNSEWKVEATTEIQSPSDVFIIYHFYEPQNYSNVYNSQQIIPGQLGLIGKNISTAQINFAENFLKRLYIPLKKASFFMNKSYGIKTQVNLDPFQLSTSYPLANLSQNILFYARQNDIPPYLRTQIQALVKTNTKLSETVLSIVNWVKSHTILLINKRKYSLATTLKYGVANLPAYLDFLAAALRSAGIPARIVHGYSLPASISLQNAKEDVTCLFPRGDYHWLEFFSPDTGWLPLDPFSNFYFFTPQNLIRKTTGFLFNDNLDKIFVYPKKPDTLVYNPSIFSEKGREEKKLQTAAVISASEYIFSPPLAATEKVPRKSVFLTSYLPKSLGLFNNPLKLDMEVTESSSLTQKITLSKPTRITSITLPLYFLEIKKFGKIWVEITSGGKTYRSQIKATTHNSVNLSYKFYHFQLPQPILAQGDMEISLKTKNLSAVFWYGIIGNPIGDKNDTWRESKSKVLHLDLCYQLK